ncbi:sensor histidine kinase [Streptomyces sp. NPDC058583]|uniref:sensor histidine kinase n=1 Tax=unclassified Streptomyces TaxID=2593676 RepID=UPI003651EE95
MDGPVIRTAVPSWPRRGLGTLLGCATALLGALHFLVVGTALGPFLLWPRTRADALEILMAGARRLVTVERARRSAFFGDLFPEHYTASDQKILRYLAVRSCTGLLCAVVIALLVLGAVLAGILAYAVGRGTLDWDELLTQVLLGGVLLFLDVQGLYSLAALDARTARECFGPSERELLQRRIDELAASRAAVVEAVDAERRRIERDLHDGVQQRLVALAMLIGRARRGRRPEQADALLLQAHEESQGVLTELREVAWRVYPSALDSLGLEEAIGGVAERSGIPLRTRFEVAAPLPRPVETAAYFVVSESVTNAAKHSSASAISVTVALDGARLTVRVEDDGTGGARETGSGLTGLRSRVAALDGVLRVHSPLGGPTTITAELPCA